MIKKITIYLFASFFMMSFATSVFAKITISSEFKYKTLPDEGTVQSCEDQGYLTNKPLNSKCDTYKGCFINCECLDGYVKVNGVCTLNDCSAYPLTGCNSDRGEVETCETNASKCRYSSCENGFTLSNGNCVCSGSGVSESSTSCKCNAGEGWTPQSGSYAPCKASGCQSGSTTPNCGTNEEASYTGDKSGGQKCYTCTCDSSTDTCTASAYPYTAADKPSTGTFEDCTTKCGGVVRYRYKACPSSVTTVAECGSETGWILVDAGITLANGTVCKQCSCSALMLGKIECPASSKCELMCNKTYNVVSTCADEGYEYSTEETVTLTTGETGRVLHCLKGQTEEYCPYDETLYKCTGEATLIPITPTPKDSCADGYFLVSDIETACACPYGIYNDGTTKSTVSNEVCYRCGTAKECGRTGVGTACLAVSPSADGPSECHTGLSEEASSCSGGAQGSICACGGTHTERGWTGGHVCTR